MAHSHDNDHPHDHGAGGHNHGYKSAERRKLLLALAVNGAVMLLEAAGGWLTGSLALLSDAGHMFTHLFALSTSYFAILLAARPFDDRKSYGWYRAEILASFVNALLLLGVVIWIAWEAVGHMLHPEPIRIREMIAIACVGLATNLMSFFLLRGHADHDLNIRSAFLHVLTDTFSSVAIIAGGFVIAFTGWIIIDPILSLGISVLILIWCWRLFRESIHILLESTPAKLEAGLIREAIRKGIPELSNVHDLHVWVITGNLYAATLHAAARSDMPLRESAGLVSKIQALLRDRFGIAHATVQMEFAEEECGHREGFGGECKPPL